MAYGKWIGGFLGFINTQSVLGAIAGFALGSLFDAFANRKQNNQQQTTTDDIPGQQEAYGRRNSFLFSLMVLSAHVIQADGKIMHSEMELVRRFLRNTFGENSVAEGNDILMRLFEYRKQQGEYAWNQQIHQACTEISMAMPEEHRIQLISFLAEIAKADGRVHEKELNILRDLAQYLRLNASIIDQMFALGSNTLEDAYKVLGITPDATDDEVRKAYKKMVIQHHPDKVANLGEDVKKAATIKLQEINNAKEIIFKARNL